MYLYLYILHDSISASHASPRQLTYALCQIGPSCQSFWRDSEGFEALWRSNANRSKQNTYQQKTHRTPSTFLRCRIDWDRLHILILSQCSGQNVYHVRYRQSSLNDIYPDSIFYLANMLACRCCLRAFARLSLSLASLLLAKVSACMGRVCRLYCLFSGVCLYVEVYRKNCPNTIGFQFSTNESTLHEYLLGDQSAEGLKHCDLQILRSWAIQKYTANQTSSKKRSNTRKSEYIRCSRCSRCSKLVSPFLGYRTSKVVYSYNVRLPDNTRHPSCTKLPCPRLLHPHPAGGELEKFRERLYQFIPTQKTSIYSNNTEAYSNQFSTSRFV